MKRLSGVLLGLALAAGGLSLSACTTSNSIVLPSGQSGYTVDCSGTNLSWAHCYSKAGKVCPHGYVVAEKSDNHGGRPVAGDLYGVLGGSVVDRSMLINCKPASVAGPVPAVKPPPASTRAAETFPVHAQ